MSEPADAGVMTEGSGREEANWVAAALAGSTEAFGRLVRAYERRAVSVAFRLIGDHAAANDVAQDAFVRAFRSLAQLKDQFRFGPWLLRIVSNLSLNYRRARPPLKLVGENDELEADLQHAADRGGGRQREEAPSGGTETAELQEAIAKAMNELPPKQKQALVLFSIEGLPQKEVAEIMECSIELVKWNVFEARKNLRKALKDFME